MNRYTVKLPTNDEVKRFAIRDDKGYLVGMLCVYHDEVRLIGRFTITPTTPTEIKETTF